jgi:hypothetical protein
LRRIATPSAYLPARNNPKIKPKNPDPEKKEG